MLQNKLNSGSSSFIYMSSSFSTSGLIQKQINVMINIPSLNTLTLPVLSSPVFIIIIQTADSQRTNATN